MSTSPYQLWIRRGHTPVQWPDFVKMKWRDAEAFFQEFAKRIPERVSMLQGAVQSSPGFERWQASYEGESLTELGKWLAEVVLVRDAIKPGEPKAGRSKKLILSDRAVSLIADVGIYLGECIRRSRPGLEWTREKGDSKNRDYNSPVVRMPNGMGFNALNNASGTAVRIAEGDREPEVLCDTYKTWCDMAALNS